MLVHVPVVFFTAKGIPGEVDERLESKDGIMAASTRALNRGKDNSFQVDGGQFWTLNS